MPLRSALMVALKQHIAQSGLTQAQAAALFGVTQPRISDLVRGLVNMASVAGLRIDMQIQPFPEA